MYSTYFYLFVCVCSGGVLRADFVDKEVKRALEWIRGERVESARYAAVLILKELAENAPTLYYQHVRYS